MSTLQRGEEVIFGVGLEDPAARGVYVAPQAWVPARTPTGLAVVVDKVDVKETRGSKVASAGSEIVQKRAEGDIEFNIRAQSFGYFAKPLLGKCVSTTLGGGNAAVFDHVMTILPNDPEHPSISGSLSQPSGQDYRYKLGLATKIDINLAPNDLINAVTSLAFATEEENPSAAYEPTFDADDVYFRHQDVVIKLASTYAGLGAASALKVKSLKTSLPNGGRPDQNVSELHPGNMLVGVFNMGGSFELDLQNTDLHDAVEGGDYMAMQIKMIRSDVTIGASANPTITLEFPKVSFPKWTPNRPIEEVVRESLDFIVHDDPTNGPVILTIRNLLTEYLAVAES